MDGRKATGGKLEVRVQLRQPVSGADVQPVTEKWLVLEPVLLSPPEKPKERVSSVSCSVFCILMSESEGGRHRIFIYLFYFFKNFCQPYFQMNNCNIWSQ